MRCIAYSKFDVLNGYGSRVVVWLSGCTHNCDGCFSPNSHNPSNGDMIDETFLTKIKEDLSKNFIKGLTWSGGDPLHKRNVDQVLKFSSEVKHLFPDKDIWLYTGYTIEQIYEDPLRKPILGVIDYLVDGKYNQNLQPVQFRGSSNQNIYKITNGIGDIVD
ncbi:anaerobic ribonucleotide reductase small subunit [Vibrio phage 11895-B1]|uniref:anaerobic ribonucleotide reductase small subunit n=1 Tax=Vibrio phage 11895-B1 TaxID=754075 RepID=UPI0002C0E38A|nr:anaerobic ribonucleotide reductase small subunit [Vibrio phage 11895-B1]AGH32195.1 anaerobic ribonucleoside-triphosphate reductase activating protein [Vibrio phage 11895-B1]